MRYQDFIIRINSNGQACQVQVSSPAGEGRGEWVLPSANDHLGRLITEVERGVSKRDAVFERDQPPTPPSMTPREFGTQLFAALFTKQIETLFDRSWGQVSQDPGLGLRIRLQLDLNQPEVARLASLPWEFLHRETTAEFLALDRRTPILRYLEVPTEVDDYHLPTRLRILVIAASPAGSAPIDMVAEVEKLEAAWQSADIDIVFPARPDIDATVDALNGQPIHVVHFIGHGSFEPDTGEGVLIFENETGGHQVMKGSTFADLLRGFDSVRLVFLNSCHTARSADSSIASPFAGVAAALVQGGVPAVLGMQFPISDPAAIRFSRVVYQSLAAGESIEAATTHGRLAIRAHDPESLEWGTPVLFSRVADGRIFESGGTAGPDDPIFWSWMWSGLGVVTSYLTLAIWAATIKAGVDTGIHLPGLTLNVGPYSAAIFGIFPLSLLVLAQLRLVHRYDETFNSKTFWDRLPLPFGLSRQRLGGFKKRVQAFFFTLFILIPVAGQVHFMNKLQKGTVTLKNSDDPFAQGLEHFTECVPITVIGTDDYRFDGVTFFPFWQPWLFLLLVLSVVIYFVFLMKRLLRNTESPKQPGSLEPKGKAGV